MTTIPLHAARTFLVGVAAASAILAGAPMASADDPSEQCAQQQVPGSEQQQCDQGPGMPNLPDNRNANNDNPQQPQQAPQQSPQQAPQQAPQKAPQQGDLADKNCWVVNGVPRWNAPGTAPAPTGPGDVVSWCPTTYGLQPH